MTRKKPIVHQLLEDVAIGKKKPGRHRVEPNLYVAIRKKRRGNYSAHWMYRFQHDGRSHWHSLGPCEVVSRAEAQIEARDYRIERLVRSGTLPPAAAYGMSMAWHRQMKTFGQCADEYIASHAAAWTSKDHAAQWARSLAAYVPKRIGLEPVSEIDTDDIREILEPIWTRIPATAMRLRGRVEKIIDYAIAKKYRPADNPARWKGVLENLLPSPAKLHTVTHHPAVPWQTLPALMAELREHDDTVAHALAFTVLAAARTNEVRGASWREIDIPNRIWTIPAARMKTRAEHRVPLTNEALTLLGTPSAGLLFPGLKRDAMQDRLRRLRPNYTVHGTARSSFHDWATEQTSHPELVIELCLAHNPGSAVVKAYRRTDLFEKRRQLMQAWCGFCLTPPAANVVALHAQK